MVFVWAARSAGVKDQPKAGVRENGTVVEKAAVTGENVVVKTVA